MMFSLSHLFGDGELPSSSFHEYIVEENTAEGFQALARVEDGFSQGSAKTREDGNLFAGGGLKVSGLFVLTDVNRSRSKQRLSLGFFSKWMVVVWQAVLLWWVWKGWKLCVCVLL